MQEKFQKFLKKQAIMSVGINSDNGVYMFNAFYKFDGVDKLIFASKDEAYHTDEILKNPKIAGTIYKNQLEILKIQGIQFLADVNLADDDEIRIYTNHFKVANFIKSARFFSAQIYWAKFTDNTLGFGHKEIYIKN